MGILFALSPFQPEHSRIDQHFSTTLQGFKFNFRYVAARQALRYDLFLGFVRLMLFLPAVSWSQLVSQALLARDTFHFARRATLCR